MKTDEAVVAAVVVADVAVVAVVVAAAVVARDVGRQKLKVQLPQLPPRPHPQQIHLLQHLNQQVVVGMTERVETVGVNPS